MYVKFLICSKKCWEIQLQRQFLQIAIQFSGQRCFLSTPQLSFVPVQFSTLYININNNNHSNVLFRPLVNSVKDENFQSTSVFYQVVLNAIQVLQCI